MAFWKRLLLLLPWRRRAAERDMAEELRSIAAMAPPRELGNLTLVAENARAEWSWRWLDEVGQDIAHAAHGFRIGRGSALLAFGILTLTLAAAVVTYSVVDAVALRSLPFAKSDELVAVARVVVREDGRGPVSPQDYVAWRNRVESFAEFGAAIPTSSLQIDGGGELNAVRVTANLFAVLGARPVLGRFFAPEEEVAGRDGVAILAHSVWTRVFNADPTVVGRLVTFKQGSGSATFEIVGILPPDVTFPIAATRRYEVFRPFVPSEQENNYAYPGRSLGMNVVGRLKPGVTLAQAGDELVRATADVRASFGMKPDETWRAQVLPLHDFVVGSAKTWLLLILAAVGCVLLVGCVNATAILLARATLRERELATRAALGASRARLARTLVAEGFALALGAGLAAIGLAYWGIDVAKANLPAGLARASAIALDHRVLLAALGAAIASGVAAGVVPAWRMLRHDLFASMRVGGGIAGNRHQARTLGAFLIAEVSFVTVLLVVSTLAIATFVAVTTADLGFDRKDVVGIRVTKPLSSLPREERTSAKTVFFNDVLRQAEGMPGVRQAGLVAAGSAPLGGGSTRYSLEIPGIGELKGADMFETREVSPGYFAAVGLRVLQGRAFTDEDQYGSPRVAIINDLAARQYFAGKDPVGQTITFRESPTLIVGVVKSVRRNGPEADLQTEIYMPLAQAPGSVYASAELVIRATGSPLAIATAVQTAIRSSLPGTTGSELPRLLNESFRQVTATRRFNAGLLSMFGMIAIAIGAIGVYGTMAFIVARQTKAIGLRMALGASQGNVLRSVLWQSLWRVSAGVGLGLVAARAASGLFSFLVFGITTPSAIYVGVAIGLGLLGVLAALIPARRAANLDPLTTLRAE